MTRHVFVFSLLVLASAASAEVHEGAARVLQFPADRSLGTLYDLNAREEFWPEHETTSPQKQPRRRLWRGYQSTGWFGYTDPHKKLGEARGEVSVPAGSRLRLVVDAKAANYDLSPLSRMQPDDFYAIRFSDVTPAPGAKQIEPVSHLTGLRDLHLPSSLSNDDLAMLKAFPALQKLQVGIADLDSTGIAHTSAVKSLKALRLFTSTHVTREDFARVASIENLEALAVQFENFDPDGYGELAKLPNLEALEIDQQECSGAGFGHLPKLKALKRLSFNDLNGRGVAALPPMPWLRELSISYEGKGFTGAQMASLSGFPALEYLLLRTRLYYDAVAQIRGLKELRTLALHGLFQDADYLTDKALEHVSNLPRLENIAISTGRFTDEGFRHLARLPRVKILDMPNNSEHTDDALAHIGGMRTLERLHLRGQSITDAGLRHLYGLQSLEWLILFSFTQATDEGMAALKAALPNLKYVDYRKP
jgi:hypothetical protein